ncbi:PSP1-domain-containing protein, partial [Gonapodya prolifera JEL478]
KWPAYVVEFKAGRKDFFYCPELGLVIHRGDFVIVEADRGKDLGKVIHDSIANPAQMQYYQQLYAESMLDQNPGRGAEIQPKRIFRLAHQSELAMLPSKIHDEELALATCQQRVKAKRLPMEVVDAEYQWDRRKLTYYFVSDRRIDFRELVRELFKIYKTRIWLCACVSNAAQGRINERQILGQIIDGMPPPQEMSRVESAGSGGPGPNMGGPPSSLLQAQGLSAGPPPGLSGSPVFGSGFPTLPSPGSLPASTRTQLSMGGPGGRFGSR